MGTPPPPLPSFVCCSIRAQIDRLAALRKIQRNFSGEAPESCEVFPPFRSPRDRGASLRRGFPLERNLGIGDPALDPSNPLRAWLYQTCTEFGFYYVSFLRPRCSYFGNRTSAVNVK